MSRFFGVKSSDQSRNTSRNHRRILGETLEPRQLLAANVYRVNAGGDAYIDRQGQLWEADNYFESGFTYETDQISEIHRTSDDELYFTERASGALKYAFPVANGSYTVNLHMAEIHWDDFGKRVFDVYLEEDRVESNIDIYKRTLNAFNPGKGTAYTYSERVVVDDGVLNVLMTSHVDNAKVSAIEILPVSGASLILTETNGDTVVSESGQTDSYGLRLNTKPTHSVTVSIAAGPGITTTSRSLQFTPWNWQGQKTNSIIAIDDNSGSGTEETFVRHVLSSADPNYNGQVVDLKVVREDDEISFTTKKIAGVPRPTTVVWGPDGRIYVGSTTGDIHALTVDDNYNVVSQQTIGTLRNFSNQNILGVAFNPTEVAEHPTIYVSHSQLYANSGSAFPSTQQSPYSGQVSTLEGPHYNQLKPLITGLPVSNHDHGVNGLQFDNHGDLYIAVGGTTNAGVKHTKLGGLDESPFSAAILKAEITTPNFNGQIQYELPNNLTGELKIPGNLAFDPATSQYWGGVARVVDGVDVSVYASGLRNPYDLAWTTSGNLYSTDNAANTGFGEVSTGANTQEPFSTPRAWDELNLIEEGNYYGHPNRNRGQTDTRQNIYYDAHDESIEGIYTEELAQIAPATGGITEYIADTFDGQLRWDLLVQRWNDDAVTIPVESLQNPAAEATVNELPVSSGLDLTVAPGGTIVGVDYSENAVTVAIPDTTERRMVAYDMLPWRASPGAKFVIGGKGFGSLKSTQVFIGGAKAQLHRVSPTRIEGTIPVFSPNKSIDQVARQPVIIESSGQTDLLEAGFFPLSLDAPNLHTESVVSINAGGPQYVDANGETWLADQFFSGGNSFSVAEPISGTVDDRLYQSERFGSFSYDIPVDNGTYNVELHLAEVFFDAPNERVFGVTAEGVQATGLIDLLEDGSRFEATTVQLDDVRVTDGSLDLAFHSFVENAKISAIRVTRSTVAENNFPAVGFADSRAFESEATGLVELSIQRGGSNLSVASEVELLITGGNALADEDYRGTFPKRVQFGPQETLKTFELVVNQDRLDEPNETLQISIRPVANANVIGPPLQLEIIDDDDPPARLPGDADENGSVDFLDFLTLASNFGRTDEVFYGLGDFDEDGDVDFLDFLTLAANFGSRH